jgi:multidrug efflux pump subunit AcrB
VLKWSLRHRLVTLSMAGALFAVSLLLMRSVPVSLLPTVQEDVFDVTGIRHSGHGTILAEAEKVKRS